MSILRLALRHGAALAHAKAVARTNASNSGGGGRKEQGSELGTQGTLRRTSWNRFFISPKSFRHSTHSEGALQSWRHQSHGRNATSSCHNFFQKSQTTVREVEIPGTPGTGTLQHLHWLVDHLQTGDSEFGLIL